MPRDTSTVGLRSVLLSVYLSVYLSDLALRCVACCGRRIILQELFALEDILTDWVELQASLVGQVVTEAMLYASSSSSSSSPAGQGQGQFGGLSVGVVVHKLVKISGATKGDAAFARQVRRKCLT
eukprot:COSAG02_NODE_13698_length_1360_cov_1.000793_3_plen_125_part_00